MRKIAYIAGFAIAGLLTSCEEFLEAPSKSSLDESVIFSNPTLTKMTLMASSSLWVKPTLTGAGPHPLRVQYRH
jgi:hypothetical protein